MQEVIFCAFNSPVALLDAKDICIKGFCHGLCYARFRLMITFC